MKWLCSCAFDAAFGSSLGVRGLLSGSAARDFFLREPDLVTDAAPGSLLIAVLPCNDLDASERFYNRLGFSRPAGDRPRLGEDDSYRMLSTESGAALHLTDAVAGWLVPGQNPFALYLRVQNVDALAAEFAGEIVGARGPEDKPWGMYEFALSDPDETLVRIGWPSRPRGTGARPA